METGFQYHRGRSKRVEGLRMGGRENVVELNQLKMGLIVSNIM